MAFVDYWSKGYAPGNIQVLAQFDEAMNSAGPEALNQLVSELRGGEELMAALGRLMDPEGGNAQLATFLGWIAGSWFGHGESADPMWLANSVLTPKQIHEVMVETAVFIAERTLENPNIGVDMYCKCGFEEFRTRVSFPDSSPLAMRVWIFGPDNMAEAKEPVTSDQEAERQFKALLAEIGEDEPNSDQIDEAHEIAEHWDRFGTQVFAGTHLARGNEPRVSGAVQVVGPSNATEPVLLPLPEDPRDQAKPVATAQVYRIGLDTATSAS